MTTNDKLKIPVLHIVCNVGAFRHLVPIVVKYDFVSWLHP